jgi:hypothetical protein
MRTRLDGTKLPDDFHSVLEKGRASARSARDLSPNLDHFLDSCRETLYDRCGIDLGAVRTHV